MLPSQVFYDVQCAMEEIGDRELVDRVANRLEVHRSLASALMFGGVPVPATDEQVAAIHAVAKEVAVEREGHEVEINAWHTVRTKAGLRRLLKGRLALVAPVDRELPVNITHDEAAGLFDRGVVTQVFVARSFAQIGRDVKLEEWGPRTTWMSAKPRSALNAQVAA